MMGLRHGWGWPLLAGLALSTIGDEITLVVLMFRAAGEHGAVGVPALLIAQLVPGLLIAPHAGRWVDSHDAARLLLAASLLQALVVAGMAAMGGLPATIAGAALLGASFAVSGSAGFALIPVVAARLGVPLARANAGVEFVASAGMLAGPIVGGLLVTWGGTGPALLFDAASFLLFALLLWASGFRRPGAAPSFEGRKRSLSADYRPLLRDPAVTILIGSLALGVAATALADVAFVFLVTVSLGVGAAMFGLLTAAWAAGMLAGSAIAGAAARRRPVAVAFAGSILMGLALLAIGLLPLAGATSPAAILGVGAAFLIGGAANSAHNVAVRTLLQTAAPAHAHGKVAALYTMATRAATIAGFAAGGWFVPGRAYDAYRVAGMLCVLAGAAGWWLFGRRRPGLR